MALFFEQKIILQVETRAMHGQKRTSDEWVQYLRDRSKAKGLPSSSSREEFRTQMRSETGSSEENEFAVGLTNALDSEEVAVSHA